MASLSIISIALAIGDGNRQCDFGAFGLFGFGKVRSGRSDNSYQKSEPTTRDAWPAPWRLVLLTAVIMAAILGVDLVLPLGVAGGVPYVAVVLLGWWFPKHNHIIILAAISTALTLVGYLYSPEGGIPWVVSTNRFLAFFAIWVTTTLLIMAKETVETIKRTNEELEQRVEERTGKFQESENRLLDIAEASTDRFWEMDETLRFTSVFDHPDETIFPPPERLIGRTRWEVAGVNPDEDEKWGKHRDDLLAHHPFHDFQLATTDEDGVNHYLSISGKPFFDEKGNFLGYRGSATDITERKQAEERIRAVAETISSVTGKDMLERLIEKLAHILEVDYAFVGELMDEGMSRVRTIAFFADGAKMDNFEYDLAGTPCENVIGKTTCVFPDNVQREFPEDDDLKMLNAEAYIGMPLFDSRNDSLGIIVALKRTPIDNPQEATDLLHIFASRAAAELERCRSEEALNVALMEAEQANRAKSEFMATMSHELRTPLNAILGFSDILSHQYFGPPGEGKYREYAEDIHASGEHLLELVNDLLDLSTIEAGKQSLVKEKLSTDEIVRECVKIITEKARSIGIELVTKVSENLPPLYADRRAMKQILLNLLSNAVKFTPEGGRITVSAKASKRNTTFKIADTGIGIPAEKLPELTNPFTRGEQDPHKAFEGWGLGLSLTKSLVDLHDGELDFKSEVGKGTTVTVTLPNGAL